MSKVTGDAIRGAPGGKQPANVEVQLQLFDQSTRRQRKQSRGARTPPSMDRGWTREDLYQRGRPR